MAFFIGLFSEVSDSTNHHSHKGLSRKQMKKLRKMEKKARAAHDYATLAMIMKLLDEE